MRCRECGREYPDWSWVNPVCPQCRAKENADSSPTSTPAKNKNIDADDFYQRHPDLKINVERPDSALTKPIARRELPHFDQTLPPPVEIPRRHKPDSVGLTHSSVENVPAHDPAETPAEIQARETDAKTDGDDAFYQPKPVRLDDIIEAETSPPEPAEYDEKYEAASAPDEPEPPSLSKFIAPPIAPPPVRDLRVETSSLPSDEPAPPLEKALPTRKISEYSPSARIKVVIEPGTYLSVKSISTNLKEDALRKFKLTFIITGGAIIFGLFSVIASPIISVIVVIALASHLIGALPKKQNVLLTKKGMEVETLFGNMVLKTRRFIGRPDDASVTVYDGKGAGNIFSLYRWFHSAYTLEVHSQIWRHEILPAITDDDREWLLPHIRMFTKSLNAHRHDVRKANK